MLSGGGWSLNPKLFNLSTQNIRTLCTQGLYNLSVQAQQLLQADHGMLLVDVRPREQFDIAHLPGAPCLAPEMGRRFCRAYILQHTGLT